MWLLIVLQLQNNTGWRTENRQIFEFDTKAECHEAIEVGEWQRPRNSDTSLSVFCVPGDQSN